MSRILAITFTVISFALVAGCATPVGSALVTYQKSQPAAPPPLTVVDHPGYYALYPGDGVSPLVDPIQLNHGDKVGFELNEGKTVGVYVKGTDTRYIALDAVLATDYTWKFVGEKQP